MTQKQYIMLPQEKEWGETLSKQGRVTLYEACYQLLNQQKGGENGR